MFKLKHKLEHGDHNGTGVSFGSQPQKGGGRKLVREQVEMAEGLFGYEIEVDAKGKFLNAWLTLTEPIRYFEKIVLKGGGGFRNVRTTVQKICGVCPVPYALAAVKAMEAVFKDAEGNPYNISHQAHLLRRLILLGNHLDSHAVHSAGLVLPKLMGVSGIAELGGIAPEPVKMILDYLYDLGNDIIAVVGGRAISPVAIVPGGMNVNPRTLVPGLKRLKARLSDPETIVAYNTLIDLYAQASKDFLVEYPAYVEAPEQEFVSLTLPNQYAFYEGTIGSTLGGDMSHEAFSTYMTETVVDYSTSKMVHTPYGSYMTGALSRLNRNKDILRPETKAIMERLDLTLPCYSWWSNTAAQIAEAYEIIVQCVDIIDELLETGIVPERNPKIYPCAGVGIGIVEAPRGAMFQRYEFDDDGNVVHCNCVIPTGMNTASIEDEVRRQAKRALKLGWSDEKIRLFIDLVVTHPDLCCSCAVHFIRRMFKATFQATKKHHDNIAVVAIGNSLHGADAVGGKVLPKVKKLLKGVKITYLDGGVSAINACYALEKGGHDAIFFIDAVKGFGKKVGDVVTLTEADLMSQAQDTTAQFSAHESGLTSALKLMRFAKRPLPETITVFGVEVQGIRSTAELDRVAISAAVEIAHQFSHMLGNEHDHHGHSFVRSVCNV